MGDVESIGAHREVVVKVALRLDEIWVLQAIARVLGNEPSDNLRRAIWVYRDQFVGSEEYERALEAYRTAQQETEELLSNPVPDDPTAALDEMPNVFLFPNRRDQPDPPQE